MKKFTLLLSSVFCYGVMNAQTVLFDNGPLVNSPGAGAGGADVSNTHDGLTTYGAGHAVSTGYKVADDFTVTGNGWTVDSIIFFGYQTNSGNFSSLTGIKMGIWDSSPMSGTGTIIYGDTGNFAASFNTYWSGIYRTTETALTDVARPIMRSAVGTPGLTLAAGTYFVSWQTDGSASFTGPWAPPVTLGAGVIITGDALQSDPTGTWIGLNDGGTLTAQGLPFIVYGQVITGIKEVKGNSDFGISNLYPVPVKDNVSFTLTTKQHSDVTITLKDAQGKEVLSQQLKSTAGANNVTLDLSKQSSGVYFITAGSKTSTVVSKFVKE